MVARNGSPSPTRGGSPDTEVLVEEVVRMLTAGGITGPYRILDIGTGSGFRSRAMSGDSLSMSKLMQTTGWKPKYNDLEYIIKTAWEWEKKLKKK